MFVCNERFVCRPEYLIKFDGHSTVFILAPDTMIGHAHGLCGFYDNDQSNDVTSSALLPLGNQHELAEHYRDTSDTRDVTSPVYSVEHPCVTLTSQGNMVTARSIH